MEMLDIFNEHKGTRVSGKRTICELIRQTYDLLVINLAESRPDVIDQVRPLLEEALMGANKMQKVMAEHRLGALRLFPKSNNAPEVERVRAERVRLMTLIEQNEQVIAQKGKLNHAPSGDLRPEGQQAPA